MLACEMKLTPRPNASCASVWPQAIRTVQPQHAALHRAHPRIVAGALMPRGARASGGRRAKHRSVRRLQPHPPTTPGGLRPKICERGASIGAVAGQQPARSQAGHAPPVLLPRPAPRDSHRAQGAHGSRARYATFAA
eukprot:5410961-Prymnesium_polylepis.2